MQTPQQEINYFSIPIEHYPCSWHPTVTMKSCYCGYNVYNREKELLVMVLLSSTLCTASGLPIPCFSLLHQTCWSLTASILSRQYVTIEISRLGYFENDYFFEVYIDYCLEINGELHEHMKKVVCWVLVVIIVTAWFNPLHVVECFGVLHFESRLLGLSAFICHFHLYRCLID